MGHMRFISDLLWWKLESAGLTPFLVCVSHLVSGFDDSEGQDGGSGDAPGRCAHAKGLARGRVDAPDQIRNKISILCKTRTQSRL